MWQRIYQGVTHYLIYHLIIYHLPFTSRFPVHHLPFGGGGVRGWRGAF